jgi:hypothetical protein
MLIENGPILLSAQAGGMWSDTWNLLFVSPPLMAAVYAITWCILLWLGSLFVPAFRASALVRFALAGALLAAVPATSAFPADRLLTWIAIGAAIALASLILPVLRRVPSRPALAITVWVLLCIHGVSIVFLPSRARGTLVMRGPLDRASSGIPSDASVLDKTLIYLNPPFLPVAAYVPIERAALGIPRPRRQRILAIGSTPMTVERLDENTLRLSPRGGFLIDPVSRLLWNDRHPFHAGDEIMQEDLRVRVTRVTDDARPLQAEFRFPRPLEDPSYLWRDWEGTRTGTFTPPKVGARSLLAGAEYLRTLLGFEVPFEVRL